MRQCFIYTMDTSKKQRLKSSEILYRSANFALKVSNYILWPFKKLAYLSDLLHQRSECNICISTHQHSTNTRKGICIPKYLKYLHISLFCELSQRFNKGLWSILMASSLNSNNNNNNNNLNKKWIQNDHKK